MSELSPFVANWKKVLAPFKKMGMIKTVYPPFFAYTITDLLCINPALLDSVPKSTHQIIFAKSQKLPLFFLTKGVQTGKNSVFIVEKDRFLLTNSPYLKPYCNSQQVNAFHLQPSQRNIIISNRYTSFFAIKSPDVSLQQIQQYLLRHKQVLMQRPRIQESNWYLWREGNERRDVDFSRPKLVWASRGKSFHSAVDWACHYHGQDVISLVLNWNLIEKTVDDALLLSIQELWSNFGIFFYLGVLNSSIFEKLLFRVAKPLSYNELDFQPTNFHQIPVPLFEVNNNTHNEIVSLAKNLEKYHSSIQKDWEIITKIESELNEKVKNLYLK